MADETEHAIPFDDWQVLAGEREGNTGMVGGYGDFLALSPGVTVAAGDVVRWTALPGWNDMGNPVRGHVFLALGDDIAPDGSGTAAILDSGVAEDDWAETPVPLEGTAPDAGTVYAGVRGTSGKYGISGEETLTVTAAPEPDPDPDPDPEPDPDPDDDYLDELAARLAPRVAAYVGRRDDPVATETAEGQVPIVAEFVRGYTRGKGWQGDRPAAPLRAVIVSATARLVLNPEQVRQYSSGDYSETGPLLTGFTLAERHVLDRYRRRWA